MAHADAFKMLLSIPSSTTDFRSYSRHLFASDTPKLFGLILASAAIGERIFCARDIQNNEAEIDADAMAATVTKAGDPFLVHAKASIRSPGLFYLYDAEVVHPLWAGKIRCEYDVPGMNSSTVGNSIRRLLKGHTEKCEQYVRELVEQSCNSQYLDAELRHRFGNYQSFLRALHYPDDLCQHSEAKELAAGISSGYTQTRPAMVIPRRALAMATFNSGKSLTESQAQFISKMLRNLDLAYPPVSISGIRTSSTIFLALLILGAAAQGGYRCGLLVPDRRHADSRLRFMTKAFPRLAADSGTSSSTSMEDGGVRVIYQRSGTDLSQALQMPLDLIVFEDNNQNLASPHLTSTPSTRWLIVSNFNLSAQEAEQRYGVVPHPLIMDVPTNGICHEVHFDDPEALLRKVIELADQGRHTVIFQTHTGAASTTDHLDSYTSAWRRHLTARYGKDVVGALLSHMSESEKDAYIKRVENGSVLLTISDCIQFEPNELRIDAIVLTNLYSPAPDLHARLKSLVNVDGGYFITAS